MQKNPLALAKGFTRGFARQIIDLLDQQLVLRSPVKTRVVQRPTEWSDQMAPLGNARLFVKWVYAYIGQLFPCASLQQALSPFDLSNWIPLLDGRAGELDAERDILLQYFKPLAACRRVPLDEAVSGFFRIRSLADAIRSSGVRSVQEYWGQAMRERDALTKYKPTVQLALPALVQYSGNGTLEGHFSSLAHVDAFTRGCDDDLLRAIAKVRLDGPHPSDFKPLLRQGPDRSAHGGGAPQQSSEVGTWVVGVQQMYKSFSASGT